MTKGGDISPFNDQAWEKIKDSLALQMLRPTYDQNIARLTFVDFDGQALRLRAGDQYSAQWIRLRLVDQIVSTADITTGCGRPSLVILDPEPEPPPMGQNGVNGAAGRITNPPPQNANTGLKIGGTAETSATADPEQIRIGIVHTDPLYGFVPVPHYVIRFWGAYLGSTPFTLWQALRSYGYHVDRGLSDWPTISQLVDTLGQGVARASIMGRAATATRPRQIGAVDHLTAARLIYRQSEGADRMVAHAFKVLDHLPLLAPAQVRTLSQRKQKEHDQFLAYYKAFNVEAWASINAPTLIPSGWWQ